MGGDPRKKSDEPEKWQGICLFMKKLKNWVLR
jgi:hypothetical protein